MNEEKLKAELTAMLDKQEQDRQNAEILVQLGLTEAQYERLDAIREQMSALDQEARQIVNATEEEIKGTFDMFSDDYGHDAAELLTEGWGVWEYWLSERSAIWEDHRQAQEEADNAEPKAS